MQLDAGALARTVQAALAEDLGDAGDVTTDAVVSPARRAIGSIVARSSLVIAGLPVARRVFHELDPDLQCVLERSDGERVPAGTRVVTLRGAAAPILKGERTALNFLMRMSGIATLAAAAVEEVAGTGVRILDTRKTAPGLRMLDKYAVAAGGAVNHRMGLFDAVMIKDTHLGAEASIEAAVARARQRGHAPHEITVEVRSTAQLEQAIAAGAGRALLDNMDPARMRACARLADGRIELEASGGLRPGKLREVAETGVDCMSLGWLTHSAPAADLAMELEALP